MKKKRRKTRRLHTQLKLKKIWGKKRKIKVQPFCREIRLMLWVLMTLSLHREVKKAHICTLSSYALVCPQPCCLLDRLALKQMIIQTRQSVQATGNDALLPQCLHRYFSGLLALWCQVCWKPPMYKRLYIFYISFTRCVPSKSEGSSISKALRELTANWARDNMWPTEERGCWASRIRLQGAHWQFRHYMKRSHSFCTDIITVKARKAPFKLLLKLEKFTFFWGTGPLVLGLLQKQLHYQHGSSKEWCSEGSVKHAREWFCRLGR